MSTKTFRHIWIFIIVSLLFHGAIVWFLIFGGDYFPGLPEFLQKREDDKSPVYVSVVDAPDIKGRHVRPEKKPKYAHTRDISVEKEEFTEGRKSARPSGARSQKPTASKPGKKTAKPAENVKREAKDEYPSKISSNARVPEKKESESEHAVVENDAQQPNLFLSEERLRELAKKYEAESPKQEKGKVLSLNSSELKYHKYMLNMKRKIELYWEYPDASARKGEEGILTVDFTITRSGDIRNVKLIKPSPYPALNDAAVTAIKLAAPFNPFPKDFDIEDVNIRGNFEYRLIGRP